MTKPRRDHIDSPFTVAIDTREQMPFGFAGIVADAKQRKLPVVVATKRRTLAAGDYSIVGMEDGIAIERKSIADLFSTIGQSRERFVRELERIQDGPYASAHVVVEGTWAQVLARGDVVTSLLQEIAEAHEYVTKVALGRGDGDAAALDTLRRTSELVREVYGYPDTRRSQLNPKTIFRSVVAWRQRYPKIHWEFCWNREWAEAYTYRVLERFWRDRAEGWDDGEASETDTATAIQDQERT